MTFHSFPLRALFFSTTLAVGLMLATPSLCFAQKAADSVMQKLDQNGDGKISRKE